MERWNKGRFGKEWDECDDLRERDAWNKNTGLGIEKIFDVRKTHNDITFIDTFLTYDFVVEHKLFSFAYNKHNRRYEVESRQFDLVKQKLLMQLTNMGQPRIQVVDANHENRGSLLLEHEHQGVDLDPGYTREVLQNLYNIWSRPIALKTRGEEKALLATFDGTDFKEEVIEEDQTS